jgi:nucleoside-diphosphate-sugar epimerase
MRAVVTGAAGFIGSHLVERLLDEGAQVVGVDCLTDTYSADQKLRNLERARGYDRFEFRYDDLAEAELRSVVEGCTVLFHLAGQPGVRDSWGPGFGAYLRNNVLATQRLLEALTRHPQTRFVYASSSSVYGNAERLPTPESTTPSPLSPYGVTKLAVEQVCQTYSRNQGIETSGLRYFSVYGPRQRPDMAFHRFCRAAIEAQPISVYGDGTQTRDFTFVADAVAATISASEAELEDRERIFNVGGDAQVSVNQAIELIGSLTGRTIEVTYEARAAGDARDTSADTTRANEELGYRPETTLERGLAEEVDWMTQLLAAAPSKPD